MSHSVRLSAKASARLDDVLDWTFDRFGPRQADRYRARLYATFDRLEDDALAGRSFRDLLAPRAPVDLRFIKVGAHLILFRKRSGRIEITDVLHEAMDVEGRVEE